MKLETLQNKVNELAEADKREVFIGEELHEAEKRMATWNVTDDNLAEIVSDRYEIVQHKEFFNKLISAVKTLQFDVKNCRLNDEREAVFAEITFDRPFADEEGIITGLRAGNSFDKTCRAFVEIYALRQVCTNGMLGRALFGRAGRLHVGAIEANKLINKFKRQLPEAEARFAGIRARAKKDSIENDTESIINILEEINIGTRHQEYILDEITDIDEISRWDLYNKATEYVENELDRTESGREKLHRRANKLLINSFQELRVPLPTGNE